MLTNDFFAFLSVIKHCETLKRRNQQKPVKTQILENKTTNSYFTKSFITRLRLHPERNMLNEVD